MVKYGLDMASAGAAGDARTMGELAHIAEESGWDGIFLEDYIVWQSHPDVPTYDPWITLAAMAMRTQRIRLGTMVTPIARRRPWKLAQELVTLDHLSNGRMIPGVGLTTRWSRAAHLEAVRRLRQPPQTCSPRGLTKGESWEDRLYDDTGHGAIAY